MTLPDRTSAYQNAPLSELLSILLRQYRRPLEAHQIHLTDAEADALAQTIVTHQLPGHTEQQLRAALIDLVAESEVVLARWDLTFQQSLDTEMSAIPGWESTAEFLEIANEKANAELRISTGAALLAALGDYTRAPDLLFLSERGDDDLDSVIARRVLLFASKISDSDPTWLDKLGDWVKQHSD
jgi:hypothetical protein